MVRKVLLEGKKLELLDRENRSKELTRALVSKYLGECRRNSFRGTPTFENWLRKRTEYWITRRETFKGEVVVLGKGGAIGGIFWWEGRDAYSLFFLPS